VQRGGGGGVSNKIWGSAAAGGATHSNPRQKSSRPFTSTSTPVYRCLSPVKPIITSAAEPKQAGTGATSPADQRTDDGSLLLGAERREGLAGGGVEGALGGEHGVVNGVDQDGGGDGGGVLQVGVRCERTFGWLVVVRWVFLCLAAVV